MQKNVASQKWIVFAFDRTDNTPKTGDAANITANLRIDGAAANAVDDVNPTELEDGYYIFDITAAESNGENIVICPASGTADIQVIGVPGAVYTRPANFPDLSVVATTGRVDVDSISGTQQTANDNGADINAILVDTETTIPGTITTMQGNVTDILADTNELQIDDTPGALTAIDGKIDTIDGIVDTILVDTADMQPRVATIEADTNELQTDDIPGTLTTIEGKIDTIDGIVDNILVDTGTTLQAELDGIQADTEDIQARIPAALVGGAISADVLSISGSTDAADKLEASAETIETAAAAAGTLSTTQMTSTLTEATDDHYNGRIIIWTSGVLIRQSTDITDYDGATKMLTYTATTEAPSADDTFVIV